jgi:hypothetical protein
VGKVLAVLHKYKVKAELSFPATQACRRPFVQQVVELCKANLRRDGPMFWEHINAQEESIFRFDAELRKLADKAVELERANWAEWVGSKAELKVDVEFSQ